MKTNGKSFILVVEGKDIYKADYQPYSNYKAAFQHCQTHFSYLPSYRTFLRHFQQSDILELKDLENPVMIKLVTPSPLFVPIL